MRLRGVAAASFFAVASLAIAPSLASPSQAGVRPCTPGYSYAGYAGRNGVPAAVAMGASVIALAASIAIAWTFF